MTAAQRQDLHETADRLHSIAIHLLRRLRKVDEATSLSGPRLSAMSVVVFAGPVTLTGLAQAEQVKPPTMTRLVQALEHEGYLRRLADPLDGRVSWLEATAKGKKVLTDGRERRVRMLATLLATLEADEQGVVQRAVQLLERAVAGKSAATPPR
jgi:DNA-binding MarR family transcriptional regulator